MRRRGPGRPDAYHRLVSCNSPDKPTRPQLLSSSLSWLRKIGAERWRHFPRVTQEGLGCLQGPCSSVADPVQRACCPSALWAGVRFLQLGRPRRILHAQFWLQGSGVPGPVWWCPCPSLALLFPAGRWFPPDLCPCRFSAWSLHSLLACPGSVHHSSLRPRVPSEGPERTRCGGLVAWWPTAAFFSL